MEVPEAIKQEWFRRLDDLTELRLADMDANGVDVQVLSYSTPGLEVIEDPAEAVASRGGSTTFWPRRSRVIRTGSRASRSFRCRTRRPRSWSCAGR